MTPTPTDTARPPRRRMQLALDLHGDDQAALARALRDLADRADRGEILHSEGSGASGGWDSGYSYRLTVDPDMDGDKYRDQLQRWKAARDAERVAARDH